jgi:hypothetical protein
VALLLVETLTDGIAAERAVTDALRTLGTRLKAATADKDKVQEALAAHPQAKARLTKLVPTLAAAPVGGASVPGPTGEAATQPAASPGGATGSAGKAAPALLQSKLEAADKAREAGKPAEAYELYKWIVERGAADAPQVQAAAPQVARYEADPAFMAAYKKAQAQEAARRLLSLGKNYEDAGRADLAKEQYRKVVEGYADTPAAEEAKKRLGALK